MVRKIQFMIMVIILIFTVFNSFSYASTPDEWISEGQSFIEAGAGGANTYNSDKMKEASSEIYNILFAIAVVVAVVIGAIIGIQLMMASAEDKASVKEALVPYVVGCIVVFGAFGIWKLIVTLGAGIA